MKTIKELLMKIFKIIGNFFIFLFNLKKTQRLWLRFIINFIMGCVIAIILFFLDEYIEVNINLSNIFWIRNALQIFILSLIIFLIISTVVNCIYACFNEKNAYTFDPNKNFFRLEIVWIAILVFFLLSIYIALDIAATNNDVAAFYCKSDWNELAKIFKVPLGILASMIPVVASLAAGHRSEQTKTQIENTNIQIENTNIQINQNEFFKGLDNIAEDSLIKVEVSVRQLTSLKNLTAEQKEAIKIAFIYRLKNPLTKIIEINNKCIRDNQIQNIAYFNYGRYILDWLAIYGNIKDNDLDNANFDYQEFSKNTNFSIFKQTHFRLSFIKAILFQADLSGANLSNSNLFGVNLSDANLSDANLFGAKLGKKDNEDSNIFGSFPGTTDFDLANLSKTKLNKGVIEKYNLQLTEEQEKVIAWV